MRGDHQYPPFEFLDERNRPAGFNVDIIRAVAEAMGLEVNIDLGPWDEVRSDLQQGRIDALIGMYQTSERDRFFDFSIPHFIASYAIFVRDGSAIGSIEDAAHKKIVVQKEDLGHDFLRENTITGDIVVKPSLAEVLRALARGEGDCAIVSRLQGVRLLVDQGITGVRPIGAPIIQSKYCLAVAAGNSRLLAQLNEGLSIIKDSGRYDEIYHDWFGIHESSSADLMRVMRHLLWVVLPLLLLAVAGFFWSWTLKKQVSLRIADFHKELQERRRAEDALRSTNELLSLFIKHSPIYAFIKEVGPNESRVLNISDNYIDMVGISAGAMVGRTMDEIFPPDFAAVMTADDWRVVSGGEILRFDEDFNGRNYTTIKFPIQQGEKMLLAGYTIDITESQRAEEELRRRENQMQKIFEILPIGLWIADKDGVLQSCNPKGLEIWGLGSLSASDYRSFKAWRLPSRAPVRADDRALALAIREGVTTVDELLEIEAFDGTRKIILNYAAPVVDENGGIEGAIVVNLDISDRKILEEKLLHAQKLESIGGLAGGVAHDFNNMLSVILGYAEIALGQMEDGPVHAALREIQQAGQRSADLTRQLLAFARKQTMTPRVLDLNLTVQNMLNMLQRLIGEDIKLAWLPADNLDQIRMDPSQIDQILANLCVNARDAIAASGGKITIETGNVSIDQAFCAEHTYFIPGNYVQLVVSDNGCGMNRETLSRLFEPFFTTKEKGAGTGLGLATVYGIVKQNNGFVHVYSEPGQGSSFKVYLPCHAAKADPCVETAAASAVRPGHETILLVEDEPMILELTEIILNNLGYQVLSAASPGEALRLAGEHEGEIDLLLTDVVMPEMNGNELARELQLRHPGLLCLFMSGYTANAIAHHGVLDEGVHFMQKPFAIQDLSVKVREVLDCAEPFLSARPSL